MFLKLLSTVFTLMLSLAAFPFYKNASDTDFFVLKNGYSFKADIIDTSGKYYVYKVYRGERLLRCVKKADVVSIQTNYVTPAVVAKVEPKPAPETQKPAENKTTPETKTTPEKKPEVVTPPPPPPVVEKRRFNPNTAPLKIRKGFEVIDTVRILYDMDIAHYKTDENAVNAFYTPIETGLKFTQKEIDSATYLGPKVNGKRMGPGTVSFENGAIYSGKVINNVLSGHGYYSDEILDYRGMFANNKFNGLGICYYFDPQFDGIIKDIVFKGEFKDGKFWEGEVFYTSNDDKHYLQQFKQGNPSSAKHLDE